MSRPSPAMIVAVTALVFAGTGGAEAALTLISGTLITPHTINESKIVAHSLTGDSIDVNRLGVVPSAERANLATNALKVGGLDPSTLLTNNCDDGTVKASASLTYFNNQQDLTFHTGSPYVTSPYTCEHYGKIMIRDKDWRAIVRVTGNVPGIPIVTPYGTQGNGGDSSGVIDAAVREVTPYGEGPPPNYREFEVTLYTACVGGYTTGLCANAGSFSFALV